MVGDEAVLVGLILVVLDDVQYGTVVEGVACRLRLPSVAQRTR